MSLTSSIEWTESTWNPITGCTKVSPGCQHCYAERMARRLRDAGMAKYRNGFALTLHPEMLEEPLGWRKPQTVFTCSMSDLFHEDVPTEFIRSVFDVMERAEVWSPRVGQKCLPIDKSASTTGERSDAPMSCRATAALPPGEAAARQAPHPVAATAEAHHHQIVAS